MWIGYIPREWYAGASEGQLACPEQDCTEGIDACKTEWLAAEHYNQVHSAVRMGYRCPACGERLLSFQEACVHIAHNRQDEQHIAEGVHVQVGTRYMVRIDPNRQYEAPQYQALTPHAPRVRLSATEAVCREAFKAQVKELERSGNNPGPTRFVPERYTATARRPSDAARPAGQHRAHQKSCFAVDCRCKDLCIPIFIVIIMS